MDALSPVISHLRFRSLLRIGAVCLLLTSGLFSANHVQASCGDYLSYGSHKHSINHSSSDQPSPNAPCHGAQCNRQQSQSKVPVPLPIRNPVQEDWATNLINVPIDSPDGFYSTREESDKFAIDHSSSIFHPPRV
jgi:hypothetical protein